MIFVMRGTTCSGKDTFIEQYFGYDSSVITYDDYREILSGDRHNQKINHKVFEVAMQILEYRLQNRVAYTVMNGTHLRMKDCSNILELSKKYHTPVTFITIDPPPVEELHRRNKQRCAMTDFCIPDAVIDKHHHRYTACMEPFDLEARNNTLMTLIRIDQNHKVVTDGV